MRTFILQSLHLHFRATPRCRGRSSPRAALGPEPGPHCVCRGWASAHLLKQHIELPLGVQHDPTLQGDGLALRCPPPRGPDTNGSECSVRISPVLRVSTRKGLPRPPRCHARTRTCGLSALPCGGQQRPPWQSRCHTDAHKLQVRGRVSGLFWAPSRGAGGPSAHPTHQETGHFGAAFIVPATLPLNSSHHEGCVTHTHTHTHMYTWPHPHCPCLWHS